MIKTTVKAFMVERTVVLLCFVLLLNFPVFASAHVAITDDCDAGLAAISSVPLSQLLVTAEGGPVPSNTGFFRITEGWFDADIEYLLKVRAMILDEGSGQFSIRSTFAEKHLAEAEKTLQRLASVLFLVDEDLQHTRENYFGQCRFMTITATYRLSEATREFIRYSPVDTNHRYKDGSLKGHK